MWNFISMRPGLRAIALASALGAVAAGQALADEAPLVDAGPDRVTPETPFAPAQQATLFGTASDDGLPGALSVVWSVASGPGSVSFGDPTAASTTASFSVPGTYQLRLTADDGATTIHDTVIVEVDPPPATSATANLQPLDGATERPGDPVLEITCDPANVAFAQYLIAEDPAFESVIYDSGPDANDLCSHRAASGLPGPKLHYWSARRRDGAGSWTPWSTPTSFETAHPIRVVETSFQDGVGGYAGTRDADIRGSGIAHEYPFTARRDWNQGAQDVLRTGHRPPQQSTNEVYRSLLRFEELAGLDPARVLAAWIELTGYEHNGVPMDFIQPNSLHAVQVAWGEGNGLVGEAPVDGEVSWLHSEYPLGWTVPGASGSGSDRSLPPLVRCAVTSGEIGSKSVWASEALTALVADWLQSPGTNHGILIQADDEMSFREVLNLASREHPDPSFRPKLVIQTLADPACSNGIDDDGDGQIDGDDDACRDDEDLSEVADCSDGLDNDADGWADYPEDPGCASATSRRENPACSNGRDDDGDGSVDLDDADCVDASDATEDSGRGCGLGAELAFLVPPLMKLIRRRRTTPRRA